MLMFDLKSCIELYITNECNLTCSNCNRFNNYDFRGHHAWTDNHEAIQAWSKRITAPLITIIGGEPTLHPELEHWVRGAARAWPDRPVCVQTNGLRPLHRFHWWTQVTRDHPNVGAGVAIHSEQAKAKIQNTWGMDFKGTFDAWRFSQCAVQQHQDHFVLHHSDPQSAWESCSMRYSHTVVAGRLYRCPMVAVLPQFQQQFAVHATQQQQQLLDTYQSLAADCSDQDLRDFLAQRHTPMPQCALCPGQYVESTVTFDSSRKKWPPRLPGA